MKTAYEVLSEGDVLTLTGRVPRGVSILEVKSFLKSLISRGVKVVIDSRSFALSDLIEVKPYLIKPNEEEIAEYIKGSVKTRDEAILAARLLHNEGIENVIISLGEKGAVMVSDGGEYSIGAPDINAVSTIGAGDSSIAGFLAAVAEGKEGEERLKYAVAFGSAACLTSGTNPPQKEKITEFLKQL